MAKDTTSVSDVGLTERLRLEFNDWARAGRGPSMEKGHRPVGAQAIDLMGIAAVSRVLDVGCGSGWATRLMAQKASEGRVTGIDVSDEMIRIARESSPAFGNVEFHFASAEKLPFEAGEFTHAFSMESLYYYADMTAALKEIGGCSNQQADLLPWLILYEENKPSHQWIAQLKVPVHLLSVAQYCSLFESAGFGNVRSQRLYDPEPIPEDYAGGSFESREDYLSYRQNGSLMLVGEVQG